MRHLAAIGLGAVILLLVGGLCFGSQLGLALALLVVCTGGVGLIPLLLGAWLAGWLVLGVFDLIGLMGKAGRPDPASPEDRIEPVLRYIRKAERDGVPASFIEEALVRNGWSRDAIDEAYRHLGGR